MRGNGWRILGWGAALALLVTPTVAMQFTDEVKWEPASFVLFGAMLAVLGGGIELAVRMSRSSSYRIAAGIALVAGFLMIWANLAVGFIGSEDNPANLIFFGIVALGAAGAAVSRLRPAGLVMTLLGMAVVQAGTGVAALTVLRAQPQEAGLCLAFAGVWLFCAWLFHTSANALHRPAMI